MQSKHCTVRVNNRTVVEARKEWNGFKVVGHFWNNNYIWGSHEHKFTCIKASRYNNHWNNTQCKNFERTKQKQNTHWKRKDEENITEWWSNATAINRPRNEDMQSMWNWLSERFVCQQLCIKINSNDAKKQRVKKKRTSAEFIRGKTLIKQHTERTNIQQLLLLDTIEL